MTPEDEVIRRLLAGWTVLEDPDDAARLYWLPPTVQQFAIGIVMPADQAEVIQGVRGAG